MPTYTLFLNNYTLHSISVFVLAFNLEVVVGFVDIS